MRWIGRRQSDNVEDRRGGRAMRVGVGGGIGTLLLVLVYMFLGGDPRRLLQTLPQDVAVSDQGTAAPAHETAEEASQRTFVSVVLADTEDAWREIFLQKGLQYEEPKLVLFTDAVRSACGFAEAAVGPFYCPANRKVYIDLSFFSDLRERFGAAGDFAQAYVIAHEVGHHVQELLGISERAESSRQFGGRGGAGALSVRMELQADCLAGVWANHAQKARDFLESGDVEEGLHAASAIGDDRIQMQSQGYVAPESFTHGSSEQRVRWFKRGVDGGRIEDCDTFAVSNP